MDLTQLTIMLQSAVVNVNRISPLYKEASEVLYLTGMRQIELFELSERTTAITTQTITITTAKTGTIRTLRKEWLPTSWVMRIEAGKPVIQLFTYLMLNRALRQSGLNGVKINGTKPETTHLFRHRIAKQMYINTGSVTAVAEFLSITNAVALRYINSIIED